MFPDNKNNDDNTKNQQVEDSRNSIHFSSSSSSNSSENDSENSNEKDDDKNENAKDKGFQDEENDDTYCLGVHEITDNDVNNSNQPTKFDVTTTKTTTTTTTASNPMSVFGTTVQKIPKTQSRHLENIHHRRDCQRRQNQQRPRRRSSITEQLPKTPQDWTIFVSTISALILKYELQLQKTLTKPPITFGQFPKGSIMENIYRKMSSNPKDILSRTIQPSLFVGTRASMASTAAYLFGGPPPPASASVATSVATSAATTETKEEGGQRSQSTTHLSFREVITNTHDGATLAIDWEVPFNGKLSASSSAADDHDDKSNIKKSVKVGISPAQQRKEQILNGPIHEPVVIILHGINNDASFGYIKSLQRTFANRGWNAAAMNFRGCGGIPLTTPRGYNSSYTGDLRNLILQISSRITSNNDNDNGNDDNNDTPIFLVGNSLGANLMTKYLGEEGKNGTLPSCVAGGVSLGNPLVLNTSHVAFPFNIFMGLGLKQYYLQNLASLRRFNDSTFQRHGLTKAFMATTIGNVERSLVGFMVRNETTYPFSTKIGYDSADAYWIEASSYRYLQDISVPFLNVSSEDDFLVSKPSRSRLGFCIGNPNIMVVETRCGGHLGWQESPPETDSAFGSISWADSAAADFIESVLKANMEMFGTRTGKHQNLGQRAEEVDSNIKLLLKGRNSNGGSGDCAPSSKLQSKL